MPQWETDEKTGRRVKTYDCWLCHEHRRIVVPPSERWTRRDPETGDEYYLQDPQWDKRLCYFIEAGVSMPCPECRKQKFDRFYDLALRLTNRRIIEAYLADFRAMRIRGMDKPERRITPETQAAIDNFVGQARGDSGRGPTGLTAGVAAPGSHSDERYATAGIEP